MYIFKDIKKYAEIEYISNTEYIYMFLFFSAYFSKLLNTHSRRKHPHAPH